MPRQIISPGQLRVMDLEAFCAVAERSSYVAAARGIGMSPSGVTRAIQAVEVAMGHALVSRSHRHVSLTPAGEAYYEVAKAALRQLADAGNVLARSGTAIQGLVRFSAPPVLESRILPAALAAVSLSHPALRVDVTYTDTYLDPAEAGLDFAIRGGFPVDSTLIGQTLWRYERYLCAAPNYLARVGTPVRPGDLADHHFVLHTGPRLLRNWYLHNGTESLRIPVNVSHRVTSGSGLIELLLAGLGISRLASWVAQPLIDAGRLVRVCPDYTVISKTGQRMEMHEVHHGRLSGSSRAVIAAIRTAWEQHGPQVAPPGRRRRRVDASQ
ncbi:MAG: LysR family transcriptional regulator [Pseudoxanthomonas sp.]